jgi:hypothetical protein
MNASEFTSELKSLIEFFSQKGYKQTNINKLLLGSSSFTQLTKLMNDEHNESFLGIKPLQRMANIINYDVHVVMVPRDDTNMSESLTELNHIFLQDLKNQIINFLNNNSTMEITTIKNKKSVNMDKIINAIIDDFEE